AAFLVRVVTLREVRAVPAADEGQLVPLQYVAKRVGSPWILSSQLASGIAGLVHLGQALIERGRVTKLRKIIVGPDDRVGPNATVLEARHRFGWIGVGRHHTKVLCRRTARS